MPAKLHASEVSYYKRLYCLPVIQYIFALADVREKGSGNGQSDVHTVELEANGLCNGLAVDSCTGKQGKPLFADCNLTAQATLINEKDASGLAALAVLCGHQNLNRDPLVMSKAKLKRLVTATSNLTGTSPVVTDGNATACRLAQIEVKLMLLQQLLLQ